MLLYLTSNGKGALVDAAARKMELNVKKLTGKFSLKSIVTRDMRNYTAVRYFVVDAACCEETADDFCVALRSFQMMFSARIIVILSGYEAADEYLSRLIECSIYNIVTADTPDGATDELLECLSEDGMQRYIRPTVIEEEESILEAASPAVAEEIEEEIVPYKWKADNVKIAVAGAQRRSGTTMTAFNLAVWLSVRGAAVAFVEMNTNRHLHLVLGVYDAQRDKEHYTIDGIDFYLTEELDRDYDFIIYDCGSLENTLPVAFREADHRLLCGSALPYELSVFHRAVTLCGKLPVEKIGICVPDEMQEYCRSVFGEDLLLAQTSRSLFADRANSDIYIRIVEEYIRN